jgi:hypothetical protein
MAETQENLSTKECLVQIEQVVEQYGRLVKRLQAAGKLPRNPRDRAQVKMSHEACAIHSRPANPFFVICGLLGSLCNS